MANNVRDFMKEEFWQKISPMREVKERQWWEKGAGKAEEVISNIVGVGSKISEDYKGEKVVGALKLLSSIFGGPFKVPLKVALSGIDYMADKKYAKKITKEVEALKPKGKGPQAEYEREQYEAILSQVNQAAQGAGKASLLSNLMDVGMAFDVPGKLKTSGLFQDKPWMKDWLSKKMPQTMLSEFQPGKKFVEQKVKSPLHEMLKSKLNIELGIPSIPESAESVAKYGATKDLIKYNKLMPFLKEIEAPSGYDWFSLLNPYYNKAIRGKPELSVLEAPRRRRGY